jgi:hypothetical protein
MKQGGQSTPTPPQQLQKKIARSHTALLPPLAGHPTPTMFYSIDIHANTATMHPVIILSNLSRHQKVPWHEQYIN